MSSAFRNKLTAAAAREYISGGKGRLTVRSRATYHHFTYQMKGERVAVFTGTENTDAKHYRVCAVLGAEGWREPNGTPLNAVMELRAKATDTWTQEFAASLDTRIRAQRELTYKQAQALYWNCAKHKIPVNLTHPAATEGWLWLMRTPDALVDAQAELWHEGVCGCCGRTLTNPTSLERGIGPECATRCGGGG